MPPDNLERVKTALQELYIGKDIGNLPAFYIKLFRLPLTMSSREQPCQSSRQSKHLPEIAIIFSATSWRATKLSPEYYYMKAATKIFFYWRRSRQKHVEPEQISPREYIFIVDVSGSMNGFPLDISKELLRKLIADLRPTDTFNVVLFASASDVLSERSLPATPTNIKQKLHVIDRRAVEAARNCYRRCNARSLCQRRRKSQCTIVIVTDGFVMVEAEAFDLIRTHLNQANVGSLSEP